MVIENAIITIDPSRAAEFEDAVSRCTEIFRAAAGCHGMALHRITDDPSRYRLLVTWESIAHHVPIFWESAGFGQWQSAVAPYFVATPVLEYNEVVADYF